MSESNTNSTRYKVTRNVTLVGLVVNIVLATAQILGGIFTFSQALIADGIHTVADLASDFVVLIAAKMASKDADDDHPYGHGRFETVATVILGVSLSAVAIGITMRAVSRLMNPETLTQPQPLALLFVALAIISKEGLYQYTSSVAKRIGSKMLEANAWHHRSDAISSLLVAIGVAGSIYLNLPWLDAVAAILVAAIIFYMGAKLIFSSTMELVDTAISAEKTNEIQSFISSIEGVDEMHMLRTRKMGNDVLADVHLQVNPYLSVSEGHFIAENVIKKLKNEFPEINDVTAHIDPEDDETAVLTNGLPSRQDLLETLYPVMKSTGIDRITQAINLHYIKGKIEIEIILTDAPEKTAVEILQQVCHDLPEIRSLTVLQNLSHKSD